MSRVLLAFKCFFLILLARRLPPEAALLLPAAQRDQGEVPTALRAKAPKPDHRDPATPKRLRPEQDVTSPVDAEAVIGAVDPTVSEQRGAIRMLGLLQREGRLLDFLQEDVDGYSDSQIGAAVRDIHRGCRKALGEHLKIEPVMGQPDNSSVRVDSGFDASRIRLVGNVIGAPPFVGTLRHPGWRSTEVRLPALPASHDPTVIAPAEVEL